MSIPWLNWEIEGARYEREREYSMVTRRMEMGSIFDVVKQYWRTYHILILISPLFVPRLRPKTLYLPIDLLRRLQKFF